MYVQSMTTKADWRPKFFGRISVLTVNSGNTGSFRCVYFCMPLMATSALQCIINNLVKDVA